jgi:hypothetical protein
MSMAERQRRRRERLTVELADEGVDLELDVDDPRRELVVDEIAYARQPPVHEQRRNSYGALIFSDDDYVSRSRNIDPLGGMSGLRVGRFLSSYDLNQPSASDLALLRRMCDGRTTFLVRSLGEPANLYELKVPADELRLSWLHPAVVVQRTPAGAVKVFTATRIYTFDQDEWSAKPYAHDATHRLDKIS